MRPRSHRKEFLLNSGRGGGGGGGGPATPWKWDARNKASVITLSSSDTIATASNAGAVLGTGRKNTGKWQFEVTITNSTNATVGFSHPASKLEATFPGNPIESNGTSYYRSGNAYGHMTNVAYGAAYTTGDVIGGVIDFTALTITWYKNGVSQGISPYFIPPTEVYPSFGAGGTGTSAVQINATILYPVSGASAWDGDDQPLVSAACALFLKCDSASGSTTFIDEVGHVQTSFVAGVAADTTVFKNGTASMNCTGGRVYFPDSADYTLGRKDWTTSAWVRGNSVATGARAYVCGQSSSGGSGGTLAIGKNTGNQFTSAAGSVAVASVASYTVVNTWHRIVGQRWGNSIMISVDGVYSARAEYASWAASSIADSPSMFAVGGVGEYASSTYGGAYGERWTGWIDDFKMVVGRALYRDRGFLDPFGEDDLSIARWESFDDDFSTDPTVAGKYTQLADTPQTWTWAGGRFSAPAGTVQSTMHPGTGKFLNCKVRAVLSSAGGVILRQQDNNNYYLATFNDASVSGSANTMNVYIRSGGTFSSISGFVSIAAWTAGTDALIEIEVIGSQLRAWFNGVLCGTWTNGTITAAGFVAMRAAGLAVSFNSFGVTVY